VRKTPSICTTAALCFLLSAATVRADMPGVDFTSINNNESNGSWSLGWSFATNVPITVTALGYYNANLTGGIGIGPGCNCGEVGIFDSFGDLLASALVTSTDPVTGFFNYQAIAPLALPGGQTFFIEAETGSSDYTWGTNGFTVDPNITFYQDVYLSSSTLAFGTASQGITAAAGGGLFGPNFLDSPASAPEPSSILLFGTVVLTIFAGLHLRRRRPSPHQ
jgi:hypothetical protein